MNLICLVIERGNGGGEDVGRKLIVDLYLIVSLFGVFKFFFFMWLGYIIVDEKVGCVLFFWFVEVDV